MERFTFKGVAANLVTYLTDVAKMSNSSAAKLVNNWCGFTSMVPLLVAPLADSYLDSYSTILGSAFFYILGLVALTSTAMGWPPERNGHKISSSSLSWPLHLISLGLGGYNPSLQAFAADQLGDDDDLPTTKDDKSSTKKSLFFQWWYFGICCGSLLGVSVLSYIQDTIGWGVGFAIPTIAMVVSILVFLSANRFYVHNNSKEISLEKMIQAIKDTVSRLKNRGEKSTLSTKPDTIHELDQDSDSEDTESADNNQDNGGGINVVKIARVVIRLLPVWTLLLTFAVIFQQPATFFTKQGMTMTRNFGPNFMIPPAALQSAITVSIILLMPLYDKYFIPLVRVFTRNEKGVTVRQRMGIGMFLSVIAMVIAAFTDQKRLEISRNPKNLSSETVPMSIFWLLPQYILLGISDIFTVVGMQEFFYSEVPVNMRTLGIALYTSVFGFGSFFSSLLISIVEHFTSSPANHHGWFSDDMKEARLDNYYWFLSVLSAVSLILFIIFCKFDRS
nr:protein NRT1/ PTR FAMILY 5.8-like [Ipomoea batatas]